MGSKEVNMIRSICIIFAGMVTIVLIFILSYQWRKVESVQLKII